MLCWEKPFGNGGFEWRLVSRTIAYAFIKTFLIVYATFLEVFGWWWWLLLYFFWVTRKLNFIVYDKFSWEDIDMNQTCDLYYASLSHSITFFNLDNYYYTTFTLCSTQDTKKWETRKCRYKIKQNVQI